MSASMCHCLLNPPQGADHFLPQNKHASKGVVCKALRSLSFGVDRPAKASERTPGCRSPQPIAPLPRVPAEPESQRANPRPRAGPPCPVERPFDQMASVPADPEDITASVVVIVPPVLGGGLLRVPSVAVRGADVEAP